jgi:hypothetical protein
VNASIKSDVENGRTQCKKRTREQGDKQDATMPLVTNRKARPEEK